MSTDDFHDVARIVGQSSVVRAIERGTVAVSHAASQSRTGRLCIRTREQLERAGAVVCVRLIGVLILTAAVTHVVLLTFVPRWLRPVGAPLLQIEAVI